MIVRLALALVLTLVLGGSAHAGEPAADEARLRRRISPELVEAVLERLHAAREAGLPTDPLVARALEGASRGADRAAILTALERQTSALSQARGALGERSHTDEIVAGASALLAGVPPDTLVSVRAARPAANLVVPLVVLCDLVARGVPAPDASRAVLAASRAGASDAALMRIRERIHERIERGGPPAGAAGEVMRQWLKQYPSARAAPEPAAPPGRRSP